ncbi:MAG TPA: AAA family ATPase [Candidatus Angelobacter sp.]|nr:AAA family ATPase [Candidatus Angelobacter sp.]
MKLHHLRVTNFAGVREADVDFGRGLNVLYGPNDLGKSTLVDAIRLVLLLPYTSTSIEQYIAWTGGREPVVELTFETEKHRIWRVRKEFGKGGSALLQESKNGQDFDDVERARKVDGRLREILRWGVPEPGGTGGGKGLPTSFLATAMLSTQSDVAAILGESLQKDLTGSGREWIAAALQAVAQDPLFVSLLRDVQARRDEAYTDKGSKKTAKGSAFKVAADRVRDTRVEKDRLQRVVDDSEGAEALLRELFQNRDERREALTIAREQVSIIEKLAAQAADRSAAAELVRCAEQEVERILSLAREIQEGEAKAQFLLSQVEGAKGGVATAQQTQSEAEFAHKAAEESAREKADPNINETVIRQELELKVAAADRSAGAAQQSLDGARIAQQLVNAAAEAERKFREQEEAAAIARRTSDENSTQERAANSELLRCDSLERALDLRLADKRVADAKAAVQKKAKLQESLDAVLAERTKLTDKRSRMKLPTVTAVAPMRRLAHELAAARGALSVGFVVAIEPVKPLDLRIQRDGTLLEPTPARQTLELEADTALEIGIPEVATFRIRGGRKDARERVHALEQQWAQEVVPHLAAAAVTDLDDLDSKINESVKLDGQIKEKNTESQTLEMQLASLAEAASELQGAMQHAAACRTLLRDVPVEPLFADLELLGSDPVQTLRSRRDELSKRMESARARATESAKAYTLAEDRATNLRALWEAATSKCDEVLAAFPDGVEEALLAFEQKLSQAKSEKQNAVADLEALDQTIASRKRIIHEAVSSTRTQLEIANRGVETAQQNLTTAITNHARHTGQLAELQKRRDAEDLSAAELRLEGATSHYAGLPIPERNATQDEVDAERTREKEAQFDYEANEAEIQRARGRLEQVGGAVARERLRDASEAFELAERQEREIEADYEAWKLLLEQMKAADAAQASNLGQALAPTVGGLFQTLTQRRYQSIQLGAQLNTEGVLVHGAPHPPSLLSVGTREQLSTLYRLALAEYLQTTVVFDDQLVQSDGNRMDWFRGLLAEKARMFQMIVLTCRPSDYLGTAKPVSDGTNAHMDQADGFIRAIDLERVVQRH